MYSNKPRQIKEIVQVISIYTTRVIYRSKIRIYTTLRHKNHPRNRPLNILQPYPRLNEETHLTSSVNPITVHLCIYCCVPKSKKNLQLIKRKPRYIIERQTTDRPAT